MRFIRGVEPAALERCNSAGSFLQSEFWGSFKARFGWNARSFLIDWEGGEKQPLLLIRRRLAPAFSFAYVPWGPAFDPPGEAPGGAGIQKARSEALGELARALRPFMPGDTAFVRFDPPWYNEGPPPCLTLPLIRAGADVQPPDTVLVDLTQSWEDILGGMKSKWRYNARLAARRGVTVREAGPEGLESFYGLLKATGRRDGIAIHSPEYYRTLFSHWAPYAQAAETGGRVLSLRCYIASHEGEDIASVIVLLRDRSAVYLYGASSDHKRNLMAPYALQLKAMEDARAAGCAEYDLFGIPPDADPAHPMAGLYRFKTGFGGRIVHRPGSWDYPYKVLSYRIFAAAEGIRKKVRTLKRSRKRHES